MASSVVCHYYWRTTSVCPARTPFISIPGFKVCNWASVKPCDFAMAKAVVPALTTTVDEAEASVATSESDVVLPVATLTSLSIASDAVSTSAAFSVAAVSGSALLSDFVDDDFAEVVSVVSGLLNTSPTASTATGAKNPTANKITYGT